MNQMRKTDPSPAATSWKNNISFILVEPGEPGNIGASARALKNMGFSRLELVNPPRFLTDEARSMACGGKDVLEQAAVYSSFDRAIADKQLIVGTTRRYGSKRGLFLPFKESAKRIVKAAQKNKTAVLFGREQNGLYNHEIEECGFLIKIPADPSFPSLNLSQSVMLVAFELSQQTSQAEPPQLVENKKIQKLYGRIQSALLLLGYMPKGDKDLEAVIMRNIKHLIGRAGLTEWELGMILGICTQIEKKLKKQ
jgi:TrmH family RNA methyltransferase